MRAHLGTRGGATLNKLGAEGWELASMAYSGTYDSYTLCTKRALP